MGKKENNSKQIELNSRTDLAEVTEQLQQLVDGLDAGEVTIAAGAQRITLAPTETVEMRFQARQKDRDERITIELRWQRTTTPSNGQQLEISGPEEAEDVVGVETQTAASSKDD